MNSEQQQRSPLRILLADDDAEDRSFFDKALWKLPIATHLVTLNDGEQLMDYLLANEEQLPDVLFLDLSMPRKSGFECLTEIKDNMKLKDMPVVMFSTSYTQDINYELSMINVLYKLGARDYIRKPGDITLLKELIFHSLCKVIKVSRLDLQDIEL